MGQSLSKIYIHLTFCTKYRKPIIDDEIRDDLHKYICGGMRELDCPVVEINSVTDHVHILFRLSKVMTLADIIESIKGSSSKWIKRTWPEKQGFYWQKGYGAFSIMYDKVHITQNYIKRQKEHHQKTDFKEEIIWLMKKHHMTDFDPDYFFRE